MTNLKSITYHKAEAADWPEVEQLLTAVNLPLDGARDHLHSFLLARQTDGSLAGIAGIERYGSLGLLRSVAVAERGRGLGQAIVKRLLDEAAESGVREIVLLTTTAADFFERHFHFAPVNRTDYDAALSSSVEWALPRCSSAVCLALRIKANDESN